MRLAEDHRAKSELTPELEAVERKAARLRQRLMSNPTSVEAVQATSSDASRMADVRAATGTSRSDLAHVMREMRRISNHVEDDLEKFDKAAGKDEPEISDVDEVVEEEEEAAVTPPSHPCPPKRPPRRNQAHGGAAKKAQES